MGLQKLGRLDAVANWRLKRDLMLLLDHIGKLQMADQFTLTPALLVNLSGRLRAVYELWREEHDLRVIYKRAGSYRYRRDLLKFGVDISIRQPLKSIECYPLGALSPAGSDRANPWLGDRNSSIFRTSQS